MSASERKMAALEQERDELKADVARLRHLLGQQMRTGESLEAEAIVNLEGEPLVNLRWDQLAAQMPAEECRGFAVQIMRVCEWAEVDASTLLALRKAGFDEDTIGGFMKLMRESRGGEGDSAAKATQGS